MTPSQKDRTGVRWLALLALPVLCCIGHAVLLAAGVGSVTAIAGAAAGSTLLAVAGAGVVVAAAAAVVLRRRRQRRRGTPLPARHGAVAWQGRMMEQGSVMQQMHDSMRGRSS